MRLFEIDHDIDSFYAGHTDPEIGELVLTDEDITALDTPVASQESKRVNIAKMIRNLESDAAELEAQEKIFEARKKSAKKEAAWWRSYLMNSLNGEGFKTPEVVVSFKQNPPSADWGDATEELAKWLKRHKHGDWVTTVVTTKIDKTAVKNAIEKNGEKIPFVTITRGTSMSVK